MSVQEGGDLKRRPVTTEPEPIPFWNLDVHKAAKITPYTEDEYKEWKKLNFEDGFDNKLSRIKIWQDVAGKDGPKGKWWIIEGRRRYRACKDTHHTFVDRDFEQLPASTDLWAFAIKSNLGRFQLDTKGKRKVIANMLGLFPNETDAAMGRRCSCDPKTVASVKEEIAKAFDKLKEGFKGLNVDQRKEFLAWAPEHVETLEFPAQE
jgi:hypothetical protein